MNVSGPSSSSLLSSELSAKSWGNQSGSNTSCRRVVLWASVDLSSVFTVGIKTGAISLEPLELSALVKSIVRLQFGQVSFCSSHFSQHASWKTWQHPGSIFTRSFYSKLQRQIVHSLYLSKGFSPRSCYSAYIWL